MDMDGETKVRSAQNLGKDLDLRGRRSTVEVDSRQ